MRYLAALFLCLGVAGCGWWNVQPPVKAPPRSSASDCGLSIGGAHTSYSAPLLSAELPDGALIAGSALRHGLKLVIALRRIDPDCRVESLPRTSIPAGKLGEIDTMVATPQADLLVGGTDGRHAIVGRLFATGRVDPTFGTRGWVQLTAPRKDAAYAAKLSIVVTSIAVGPRGSIVVGGNDGGGHCCARDFVDWLGHAGKPARALVLPGVGGSYITDVYANKDSSVYALTEYEQSGCGDTVIQKIDRDGTLDARFDATIKRTVKKVASRLDLRFTPTLVPAGSRGAFLLVGGLDKTCIDGIPSPSQASGGVSVSVNASGQISRRARPFPSPGYAFDAPAAIRLPSGQIVVAAVVYSANGRAKSVDVRTIEPDGAAGSNEALPLARSSQLYPSIGIGLFSGTAGFVRLVISRPKELDVTSLPIAG